MNYDLQLQAYDALGSYDGAVVVMEPETGRILAMVSKPDFDPNTIADDWDTFVSDDSDSSVLLNRATQGLYPPGSSTFMRMRTMRTIILTAAASIPWAQRPSTAITISGTDRRI